jgi:hypothetical protein
LSEVGVRKMFDLLNNFSGTHAATLRANPRNSSHDQP